MPMQLIKKGRENAMKDKYVAYENHKGFLQTQHLTPAEYEEKIKKYIREAKI